jgi:acetoin utilization deacetylase AcuC-like enzyme
MTLAIISHPDCALHEMGIYHPESAARLAAIQDRLLASGLDMVLRHYDAPLASRQQLCLVHDKDYVDDIFQRSPDNGQIVIGDDVAMNPHTLQAALRAAGAVVKGVELVMSGEAGAAFCNVRPPGHHAGRRRSMGFCIFNNVAVGAAYALQTYGLDRVAIIDFDAHHGNGTEEIFRDHPSVMICSVFQHPYYPNTGRELETANIVNVPLAAGSGGEALREAVVKHWLPALARFQPQLILISAGFDGHAADDMSDLNFTEQDYAWLTREIRGVADEFAQGRIVSVLEGGYELSALGRSVAAHIDALL